MHLNIDNADGKFSTNLLNVGNGLLKIYSYNQIQLPFQTIQTEENLIARVFPDIHIQHFVNKWLCDETLLAPRNVSVKEMSVRFQNMLPGDEKIPCQLII